MLSGSNAQRAKLEFCSLSAGKFGRPRCLGTEEVRATGKFAPRKVGLRACSGAADVLGAKKVLVSWKTEGQGCWGPDDV